MVGCICRKGGVTVKGGGKTAMEGVLKKEKGRKTNGFLAPEIKPLLQLSPSEGGRFQSI
jgi:hypothetical protein